MMEGLNELWMDSMGDLSRKGDYIDLLRAVKAHPEDKPFIVQMTTPLEAKNLRRKLYTFLKAVGQAAGSLPQTSLESVGLPDLKALATIIPSLELQVRGDELAILRSNMTSEALAIRDAIAANAEAMRDPGMTVTKLQQRLRDIRARKHKED